MGDIKATLTRKVVGVPTYVYMGLGIAVLAYMLYRRRIKRQAEATAGTANGEPTTATNAATSGRVPYGFSGMPYDYSGAQLPNYNPPQGSTNAPVDPNTYNGYPLTPISGEKVLGGGYTDPVGYFWKPVVTSTGIFQYTDNLNPSSEVYKALKAAGAALFFQSSPGVFTPAPSTGLPAMTPIYQQLPGLPFTGTVKQMVPGVAQAGAAPTSYATK